MEGSECFITSYFDVTHIIVDREEEVKCFTFREIDFMDVTSWILEDIECNFEEWVKWSPYEDTDLDYANRRIRLRKLIDEVKEALERERGRGQV